jgi:type I restriction enzyme S subunit
MGMDGWQTKTLGEICDIERGGSPRPIQEFITADPNGINWIKIGDATASGKYIYKTVEKIKPEGVKRSRMVYEGDFILSNSMSFGRPYIMKTTGCIHDGWLVLHQPKVDPDYLYHALSSDLVFDQFDRLAAGSTVRNLNIGLAKSVEIPYPPLAEQQRIVGLLDEAFEGLATAKANAEKNLQNVRALFESHLQSVFTQRGPGWVETTLEEVLTVQPQNGWSPPAANHAASGTPVLTLSSVTGFVFRPDKLKYTSAKTDPKARYWIQNGDFLITRSNTPELVGHVAIASGIEKPTIYPDLIMRMNPKPDRALTEFLYYQLRTPVLRAEIMGRAQGANPTMKKISNGAVKTLPIAVPSIPTQQAIVETLDALTEETQHLARIYEQKLAALEALKKSLLHQAFTGAL